LDKEIVENYGWIVIILIVGLTVVLMTSPIGNYLYANMKYDVVETAVEDKGLFDKSKNEAINDNSLRIPIDYQTNGGNWDGGFIDFFISGKETVLPTNIKKTNYVFAGWYTSNSFDEQITTIKSAHNYPDSGIKLYAKWIGEEYAICYNLDGGNFTENSVVPYHYNYGTKIISPTPVKKGYNFKGWTVKTQGSLVEAQPFDANYLYSQTITFYAQWEKVA
jgi:uncharacterized repeat protein (TIGR02543 family)